MANKLTASMTREDMMEVVRILQEHFEPVFREVARQRVDDVIGRVLNLDDADLRNRVESVVRKLVAEEIDKHIEVRVGWK